MGPKPGTVSGIMLKEDMVRNAELEKKTLQMMVLWVVRRAECCSERVDVRAMSCLLLKNSERNWWESNPCIVPIGPLSIFIVKSSSIW